MEIEHFAGGCGNMQAISAAVMRRACEPLEGDLARRARKAYLAGWAFWIVFIAILGCVSLAPTLLVLVDEMRDFEWLMEHINATGNVFLIVALLPGLIPILIAIWARQCRQWGWRQPTEMRFARRLFERARRRIELHLSEGESITAFTVALPLYNSALSDVVVAITVFCGIGWWVFCQFIAPRIRSIYGADIPFIWWFDVTNAITPSLVYIGALIALFILARILHPGSPVHVASSLVYTAACVIMSFVTMLNMSITRTQFYKIATLIGITGAVILATLHAVDIVAMLLTHSYRMVVRTNNRWRLFATSLLGRAKPLSSGRVIVERWREKLNGVELRIAIRGASEVNHYRLLFPSRLLANDFANAIRMENRGDIATSAIGEPRWRSWMRMGAQIIASIALYTLLGIPWIAGSMRLGQAIAIGMLFDTGVKMLRQYADVDLFETCIVKAERINRNSPMTLLMQGMNAQFKHDLQRARTYYQAVSKRVGVRKLHLIAMAHLREIDREQKLALALRQKAANMARHMKHHPEAMLHFLLARSFMRFPATPYRMVNKRHVAFHLRKALTIDPALINAKRLLAKYEHELELLEITGRYELYNKIRW